MAKKILVLGGGTGGVVASLFLSEQIKRFSLDAEVTLVNKTEWHYMPPLWMDVALEGIPLDETRAPIRGLEKYGVSVVVDEATKIDLANRRIDLAGGKSLEYDYLIVALGVRNGWEAYPGLAEEGYHNYDPESAVKMNTALKEFKGGKIVILTPELPFRCGIYPMEFATMLAAYFESRKIPADITVALPRDYNGSGLTPVELLGPDIEKLWRKYFEKYNIKVVAHNRLERVDAASKMVVLDNAELDYDFLIKVPPPRLPKVLDAPEFVWDRDPRFTKAKAPDFRHPEYDDIFLIGEHAMPPTGLGLAGVFIHNAAYRVGSLILEELGGRYATREIPPVLCVAYIADKGFMGMCNIWYDTSRGMYSWGKCYNVLEAGFVKLIKRSFYQGWLDRLRV